MANYKEVENAVQRAQEYKDGNAMSVGYQFFDEKAYESAKRWLESKSVEYIDNGYRDGEEFDAQVIVTSYTRKDGNYVFEHIDEAEECRLCVVAARMVDITE